MTTQTPPNHVALMEAAKAAADHAYAPYSGFLVGAAVQLADGTVVTGANVENASYGLTVCAERVALCKAMVLPQRPKHPETLAGYVRAIAVYAPNNPHGAVTPCGACRQVMSECMTPETPIVMMQADGATQGAIQGELHTLALSELLPHAFGLGHHNRRLD